MSDWIAVDWGTTHLRVWGMTEAGKVTWEAASDDGMAALDRAGFEPALLALAAERLTGPVDVIACGMVGSRQGWVEAPYAAVPCAPLATPVRAPTRDTRLAVHVLPGVKQASPPDVMRGEETQIAGYLAANPRWDGVICLPGTHSKWAHVSAGEIVSFQTFLTGEMFALLTRQSILRHSIGTAGWDEDSFAEAVSDTLSRPERLAARLFTLRADHLLNATDPATLRARLSGLLIGAELAAARPYWLGQPVAVVGATGPGRAYAQALTLQGAAPTLADAGAMTRAGLTAAFAHLHETSP